MNPDTPPPPPPGSDAGTINDGFGNEWPLCKPGCLLEVVRPGKVQCAECDIGCDDTPPDPAAEIARLKEALNSFDAIDKERNDALKVCMSLLEDMHSNRNQHKVAAYTDEIEAAMAQIKTCYDPHA